MAANFSKPVITDNYTSVLTDLSDKDTALAVMQDPALVTPTNTPNGAVRWNSAFNSGKGRFEKFNGTTWDALSVNYSINIDGSATTASSVTGLSVLSGKTLTVNNNITLAGTDGTSFTLPASSGTLALNNQNTYIGTTPIALNRGSAAQTLTGVNIDGSAGSANALTATALGVANTWTGTQTFNGGNINGGGAASTYGAISINGAKAGWGGVNFRSGTTNYGTLMMTPTTQGVFNAADDAWLLKWDQSGNFTATANVTAYSDERLKNNWANLADDFIQRLSDVKHGTYNRIDIEQRQVGVSAQSLQKVMPEAVMLGEDGMLSVSYGNAALATCVELAKEIVILRDKIAKLELGK
jgi:hypothetical protein